MSGLASQLTRNTDPLLWTAEDCVRDISASPVSNQLALADASGSVSVFNLEKTDLVWSKFAHELGASLIDWCNGAELIASAGQDGYIKLWQPQTGEVVKVLRKLFGGGCWEITARVGQAGQGSCTFQTAPKHRNFYSLEN